MVKNRVFWRFFGSESSQREARGDVGFLRRCQAHYGCYGIVIKTGPKTSEAEIHVGRMLWGVLMLWSSVNEVKGRLGGVEGRSPDLSETIQINRGRRYKHNGVVIVRYGYMV